MRVGIMTGGGDCPGLNAVIRAVVKSLVTQYDATCIGIKDGALGLIERRAEELSYRDVGGILTRGGTILGTHNTANPFHFKGRDGADVSDAVVAYYEDLDLDALVTIGGDGTMSMCHRLQDKGIDIVGIPKTIDNDVIGTDRTVGFDTAVSIATDAVDRLHTTGKSHNRVMILETMGRYSGWIAAHAGMAGGADVILIPEFPYDVEEVARVCLDREARQKFTIVAISEGARPQEGEVVVQEKNPESYDQIRLGGVGYKLKDDLRPHLDSEIRTTVLGHIQRGGTPTPFDRVLATNFGAYAAEMVAEKKYGRMVAIRDNTFTSVALSEVAEGNRQIPKDSPILKSILSTGISFGVDQPDVSVGAFEVN